VKANDLDSDLWLEVADDPPSMPITKDYLKDNDPLKPFAPEKTITDQQRQLIKQWIMSGAEAGPTYREVYQAVLVPECLVCHSGAKPAGNYDFSTYEKTMASGKVIAKDLANSDFWLEVADDPPSMPITKDSLKADDPLKVLAPTKTITDKQRQLIRKWIEAGAHS